MQLHAVRQALGHGVSANGQVTDSKRVIDYTCTGSLRKRPDKPTHAYHLVSFWTVWRGCQI